ncbi:dsDNA nuclease domain-containing protein [Sinorhizobium medicae]|uniref:dsDNA nuclease domain-containing protein n=1 Tax=Sinorhizobium medicae TaxID=110321 RepID=UPI00035F8F3E|nr:dsDNA nuclease domain-containing protein [Sinorhizobium medicae]
MIIGRALSEADSTALVPKIWPSIDNVSPKEQGGPIARQGFSYQDEIAVGFMLDMIADAGLVKIHFETHDDLVLVRSKGGDLSISLAFLAHCLPSDRNICRLHARSQFVTACGEDH